MSLPSAHCSHAMSVGAFLICAMARWVVDLRLYEVILVQPACTDCAQQLLIVGLTVECYF